MEKKTEQMSDEALFLKYRELADEYWYMTGLAHAPGEPPMNPADGAQAAAALREELTMMVREVEAAASALGVVHLGIMFRAVYDRGRHSPHPQQIMDLLNECIAAARKGVRKRMKAEPSRGHKIFIGHGRSPIWRELKDFVRERCGLEPEEYSLVATAGYSRKERLEQMRRAAGFALLVLTGEDEQPDGTVRARQNVVHEVGLFQGHLGFERAIILKEDGCEIFSNADGLDWIPFPKDQIGACFEEVRRVLEREGLLRGPGSS